MEWVAERAIDLEPGFEEFQQVFKHFQLQNTETEVTFCRTKRDGLISQYLWPPNTNGPLLAIPFFFHSCVVFGF